jgi:hypothetical protein
MVNQTVSFFMFLLHMKNKHEENKEQYQNMVEL